MPPNGLCAIKNRDRFLALELNPEHSQLNPQSFLIKRFEKPRPQLGMNANRRANDPFNERLIT